MAVEVPESARDLILGNISVQDYFAGLDEEQRFRGDARLLRRLLSPERNGDLTTREQDVLVWAARGSSAKETAMKLEIATDTVRKVRRRLMRRLRAKNMTHAVALWLSE